MFIITILHVSGLQNEFVCAVCTDPLRTALRLHRKMLYFAAFGSGKRFPFPARDIQPNKG